MDSATSLMMIRYLLCLLMFVSLPAFGQDRRTFVSGFGVQSGYAYRKLHEVSIGGNFSFAPKIAKAKGILCTTSLDIFPLFSNKKLYMGERFAVNIGFWQREKYFLLPNFGGFIEYVNKGLNSGANLGINYLHFIYLNYNYTFLAQSNEKLLYPHNISLLLKLNWSHTYLYYYE